MKVEALVCVMGTLSHGKVPCRCPWQCQFMGGGVKTFGGDKRLKTSGLSGEEGSADLLRREARDEGGAVTTAPGSP